MFSSSPTSGGPATDALGAMEEAEAAAVVRAATWDLEPRERDALRLCYLDGFTHLEIARRMGRTVGSVSGLIRRARVEFRLRLTAAFGEE